MAVSMYITCMHGQLHTQLPGCLRQRAAGQGPWHHSPAYHPYITQPHLMRACPCSHACPSDGAAARPMLQQLLALRQPVARFVAHLQAYLQFEVLETCWQVRISRLSKCALTHMHTRS